MLKSWSRDGYAKSFGSRISTSLFLNSYSGKQTKGTRQSIGSRVFILPFISTTLSNYYALETRYVFHLLVLLRVVPDLEWV